MLALAARGWPLRGLVSDTALSAYLARPDQRSYDLADLTLRYLKRELKQGATDDGPADPRRDRRPGLRQRRRLGHAARPRGARPGRGARRRARRARRHPLLADVELPLIDLLARMEQTGDRGRHRPPRVPGGGLRRRGEARRRGRLRRDRQGDQPRLAQAAAGGALRRARDAQDQAHQDRLHHRRRRAAVALREDRAPVPAGTCCGTATSRGCGRPSRGCSRRWRPTAASTPPSTS